VSVFTFQKISPESMGIPSSQILEILKMLDDMELYNHALLIAKGDNLICEAYYKPFSETFLHRAYSVSKSFVSAAVGVAVTEELLSLDDVIIDFLPEFKGENTDDGLYEKCTVRDMLKMSSNIGGSVYWWGKFKTRTHAYYSQKSVKTPGSLYFYDSIGSFVLGVIIEKLTGKDFLSYLKEKVLLELGFSKESYVLTEPGGYAIGDSGVMCTLRDLFILARLFAKGGTVNGKRYIDVDYVKDAISPLCFDDIYCDIQTLRTGGYGYLIRTIPEGFVFTGLGDQLVFYDKQRDITFVILSDNQGCPSSSDLIYHIFSSHLLSAVQEHTIIENVNDQKLLSEYENSRLLLHQYGNTTSTIKDSINSKHYKSAINNSIGITDFSICFSKDEGKIKLVRNGKYFGFDFGLGYNKFVRFSFGERAKADMMGVWEKGEYDCATSAAFVNENTLVIKLQVIDTYFGKLQFTINFNNNEANMYIKKQGQYVFDGIEGYVLGKFTNEE